MGMGMLVAVSPGVSSDVEGWLSSRLVGTRVVGEVVSNGRMVTHVDPQVTFSEY